LSEKDLLLDVSRLVWRVWRGALPTGIDRVCLAYLSHYRERALAVLQRKGAHVVLPAAQSDRLFDILLGRGDQARRNLVKAALTSLPWLRASPPRKGMCYINVGHTGLDEPSLPKWIERHDTRAIFMVHDLIPITHPEFCRPGEADKHRKRMSNLLRSATGVIANSGATLDDLAHFAEEEGQALPTSVVAWLGVDRFAPNDLRPTRLDVPHFVTIGTIEGRKNHVLLLRIWRRLAERLGPETPKLVIIGQRGWEAKQVFEQLDALGPLQQHVVELGRCSDAQLAGYLAGAEALLMPSFAEGFGLPVVEALRLGTHVVASDLPALREIGGTGATYLDPLADAEWEEEVARLTISARSPAGVVRPPTGYRAPDWQSHFDIVDAWLDTL
jgi:glycosyltransferase involved in cell wall biosynthesis